MAYAESIIEKDKMAEPLFGTKDVTGVFNEKLLNTGG